MVLWRIGIRILLLWCLGNGCVVVVLVLGGMGFLLVGCYFWGNFVVGDWSGLGLCRSRFCLVWILVGWVIFESRWTVLMGRDLVYLGLVRIVPCSWLLVDLASYTWRCDIAWRGLLLRLGFLLNFTEYDTLSALILKNPPLAEYIEKQNIPTAAHKFRLALLQHIKSLGITEVEFEFLFITKE